MFDRVTDHLPDTVGGGIERVALLGGNHGDAGGGGHLHNGGHTVGQDTVPGITFLSERACCGDGLQPAAHADGQGFDRALAPVGQGTHQYHGVLVHAEDTFPNGAARLQRAEASLEGVHGNNCFQAMISLLFDSACKEDAAEIRCDKCPAVIISHSAAKRQETFCTVPCRCLCLANHQRSISPVSLPLTQYALF